MKRWPEKQPEERLDYQFDWTGVLAGDTMVGEPTVSATGGLTIDEHTTTANVTTLWISGGAPSEQTRLDAHVCLIATTVGGRKIQQKIGLPIGTGC